MTLRSRVCTAGQFREGGTVTLVAGVANVSGIQGFNASSVILHSRQLNAGTATGNIYISNRSDTGGSFTITSTNTADTSTVAWAIF